MFIERDPLGRRHDDRTTPSWCFIGIIVVAVAVASRHWIAQHLFGG